MITRSTRKIQGQRFGRLVALSPSSVAAGASKSGNWLFQCDCGEKVVKSSTAVKCGNVKSCGCLRREISARGGNLRHGHCRGGAETPTWSAWQNAKKRCYDPNCARFPRYGGRGIGMSRAWYLSFEQFLADMGGAPAGTSIDRIDLDGHYQPGNCRWATPVQQARKTSLTVWLTLDGMEMSLAEAAEVLGVPYMPFYTRVRINGMSPHDAARQIGS